MRKDKIFKLILGILAVFSTQLVTEVECIEARIGQEVRFHITIPEITESLNALETVYHPSTNVLFIVAISNGVIKSVTEPSESVYKDQISGVTYTADTITFQFRVTISDAGTYSCKNHQCLQILIVADKPSKPAVVNQSPIIAYTPAEINCSTTSNTRPVNHGLPMKYIWRKNGQIIPDSSNSSLTLMVERKMKGDRLTCQAYEYNNLKSDSSEPFILDPDFEPEEINILPASVIEEKVGNSLTVICSVDCKPNCTILWLREKSIPIYENKMEFSNLKRSDAGDYTCHAENTHGSSDEGLTIHVHYKPIIISEKLKDMDFKELEIKELSNVNITLEIDSNPKPDISWFKNGKILPDNETTMVFSGPVEVKQANINKYIYNSVYKIIQAQCTDMANYSATISNKYGEISSSTFHLKVLCKPRIDSGQYFKTEFAPELGDTVDINMRVLAYPAPVISTIYHNGSVIPISVFNITNYTPTDYLTVFTITKHVQTLNDLGFYHVELCNNKDKVCNNKDNVNITVYFKDKGSPSTPADLSVSKINALSIILQWTSTFNGGEKQTFSVWYKHLYGNWTFYNQTYHDPGEGLTVTAEIKGLRDLTAYLFRVRSKNKYGMSDFTPSLPVTTIELKEIPLENAGISTVDIGMWVGISIALVVLIIAVIIAIFFIRKKYQEKKKDKFFKDIRDAGDPMMPGQFLELTSNHLYEEITEHRLSKAGSPSTNSNGTDRNGSTDRKPAPTSAPPKPPRTFEEPIPKKPEPIWKPVEKKPPKVNENTLHLAVARKSLKPVTNKGQL